MGHVVQFGAVQLFVPEKFGLSPGMEVRPFAVLGRATPDQFGLQAAGD
jgi:hypothetical protein